MEEKDKGADTKQQKPKSSEAENQKENCGDKNCPICGGVKTRGKTFTGKVVSDKMNKTATIEWSRKHYIPKYERYEKRRTRVKAHNSNCIKAKTNDIVKISECRPLSKTKRFVIIEKIEE